MSGGAQATAMLALEVALLSDRGGRKYNEDACGHWHSERHLCCALADGAGGHGGGDIAARLVVSELIGRFAQQPSAGGADLAALLRATNRALIAQRVPGTPREDMHSTAVCLVIDFVAQDAHWAHAGDSRIYWFRGGRLLERTCDHSVVQALVDSGHVRHDQARGHARSNVITRAVGAHRALELDSVHGGIQPGDRFLLCSDGLTAVVDDREIADLLMRPPLQGAVDRLINKALSRGAPDNVTAVLIGAEHRTGTNDALG